MRLAYSGLATEDLNEIHAYVAADSSRQADRMIGRLAEACGGLTTFPLAGRPADGGVRELTTAPPYVIVYRVESDVVRIERVFHGARRR